MGHVTIWDGNEIRVEQEDVAKDLIAKDMAQDMAVEDGLSLKYRHQFTGYKTRELRAEVPPTPVVSTPDIPQAGEADKSEDVEVVGAGVEAALNWEDYKSKYRKATGSKRATRAAVEAWMSEQGIM